MAQEKKTIEDRDRERVEQAKNYIAKALNLIEASSEIMDVVCSVNNWNDEVVYQIKESATGLGFALATITRWYDALDEKDDE